jgi:hypothetical protein
MTQNKLEEFVEKTIGAIFWQWEKDMEEMSLGDGERTGRQDAMLDDAMDMEAQAREVLRSGDDDRIRRFIRGLLCDWENPYRNTIDRLCTENHELSVQLHAQKEDSRCLTVQMR